MPARRFDAILFDADETLFDFDAQSGLRQLLASYQVDFTDADYAEFSRVNVPLWTQYHAGQISATTLQVSRFQSWSQRLDIPAQRLNDEFLETMAALCQPLQGARELLAALQGKVRLGLITNGFTRLQRMRLERTGLADVFDCLVISEELGVAKPERAIFDHALEQLGNPPRERVLMVGDRLDTDVLGALNSGLVACWLNAHGAAAHPTIRPHHAHESLDSLRHWLFAGAPDGS